MTARTYRGLTLDPFQEQAFAAIDAGSSVIVAAPTGTGKTLVADYLIERAMQQNLRAIYTAPIKALSNQKFKDFRAQFGNEAVGIMTGDVVLNPDAPVLIMTTEIFRNQVITEDPSLQDVSYVIFDEVHWLNDEERGTVWEESIILAPPQIKILGLSATIANAQQLASWIASVRHAKVELIEAHRRIVPLEYYYFTKETGLITYDKLWRYYLKTKKERRAADSAFPISTHLDLIRTIERQYLPALYFVFSRKQCAEKARELAVHSSYLRAAERRRVEARFLAQFGPEEAWSASTRLLKRLCSKGIAFHHAGLLPAQKVIVEELFQERLIRVLYCTETFSVGINYPVKSVCFDSLRKFDGRDFRPLANHEFFQMSGRAGRRGIDEKGYSFVLVDLNYLEQEPLPRFRMDRLEPLSSQFRLSYNTVLNLTATLNPEQVRTYFEKSFATYTHRETSAALHSQLAEVENELQRAGSQLCDHVGSLHCPLKYFPKKKDLERLRRAYQALGPRKQGRIYGREMARRIRSWENMLRLSPAQCPAQRQESCRQVSKNYWALQERQRQLSQELAALPAADSFLVEFEHKKNHLRQMGYLRGDDLLPRGLCASRIYIQELLVTELIFSDIFLQLDDDQLNALLSSIDFEARRNDMFQRASILNWEPVLAVARYVQSVCGPESVRLDPRVAIITHAWSQGMAFADVQRLCNLDEGDIISVFRRTIDLLRQMRDAVPDPVLRQRLKDCMDKLDRDEAAVLEI